MTRGRSMLSVKIWKEHFEEISKKIGRFATKTLSWIRKRKQKKIFSLIQIQAGLRTCQIFQFFLRLKLLHHTLLRVQHYHRTSLVLFFSGHSSCSCTFHGFRFALTAEFDVFLLILLAAIFPTVHLHVTLCAPFIRHFAAQTEILAVVCHGKKNGSVSYQMWLQISYYKKPRI